MVLCPCQTTFHRLNLYEYVSNGSSLSDPLSLILHPIFHYVRPSQPAIASRCKTPMLTQHAHFTLPCFSNTAKSFSGRRFGSSHTSTPESQGMHACSALHSVKYPSQLAGKCMQGLSDHQAFARETWISLEKPQGDPREMPQQALAAYSSGHPLVSKTFTHPPQKWPNLPA